MKTAARLLTDALRAPETTVSLDAAGWTALLTASRAEQLIASLEDRLKGHPVPPKGAREVLTSGLRAAEQGRVQALWEAEMCRRALEPLNIPFVLLKGTAFIAAGLEAGKGRFVGDLDILVPRERLDEVERALLGAGWEWVKDDAYDSHYYRTWMHELPPLIHRDRDRMIDVHHTILPPTARPKPDPARLIADSVKLPNGLRRLSDTDIVIHAVAHLLADGDLAGGLRNLWDIDRLCREFSGRQDDFFLNLLEQAFSHNLGPEVCRALRISSYLFGTPVPAYRKPVRLDLALTLSDRLYIRRLLARDGWGRPTRKLTRFAFYIRSHWIRMPPLLLVRHLWTKAQR
jgi:hypothetical protein